MPNRIYKHKIRARESFFIAGALLILLFLMPANRIPLHSTTGCTDCSRSAWLDKFVNVHAPQYEKNLEEWNKCMQQQLGTYVSFDPDDPKVMQAMEGCAHLAPDTGDSASLIYPSSVLNKLAGVLTSPCFHLVFGHGSGPPEYFFRGSFDAGLTGQKNDRGRDIKSRLTLELYYNGEPVELVKSWTTESTLTTISSQYNRMFDNSDAEMRREKPIENLLRDFERRPASCEVDLGETKEVGPGEEIEVKLKDFRDEQGRVSKYFNRVVVEAEHGRIKGGTRLLASPDWRAFRIDEGTVTFAYEAPNDCAASEDRIIIHSSCSILDAGKNPMEMTSIDKKIAEETIKIACPDLIADYNTTIKIHREALSGSFFSAVRASYQLTSSKKMDDGMIRERYKLVSSALKSFSGQATYSKQLKSTDCEGNCYGTASPSGPKIHQGGAGFSLYYDEKTGSVEKVELDSINVEVECLVQVQCTEKCKYPPHDRSFQFSISPFLEKAIEVVDDMFKVERVSGSREGGVISGSAELNAGLLGEWNLQFSFRKIKR